MPQNPSSSSQTAPTKPWCLSFLHEVTRTRKFFFNRLFSQSLLQVLSEQMSALQSDGPFYPILIFLAPSALRSVGRGDLWRGLWRSSDAGHLAALARIWGHCRKKSRTWSVGDWSGTSKLPPAAGANLAPFGIVFFCASDAEIAADRPVELVAITDTGLQYSFTANTNYQLPTTNYPRLTYEVIISERSHRSREYAPNSAFNFGNPSQRG